MPAERAALGVLGGQGSGLIWHGLLCTGDGSNFLSPCLFPSVLAWPEEGEVWEAAGNGSWSVPSVEGENKRR